MHSERIHSKVFMSRRFVVLRSRSRVAVQAGERLIHVGWRQVNANSVLVYHHDHDYDHGS